MFFEASPRTQTIVEVLTLPYIYLVLVPIATIYHTYRYFIRPEGIPRWWTYKHYIGMNTERMKKDWGSFRLLPRIDKEHWTVPEGSERRLTECDVCQITVKPISDDVPRIEVLQTARDVVHPAPAPGFMIRPKRGDGSVSTKDDLLSVAKPGERIVYFIVGGGFVGGHTLRNHVAWSLAKLTGERVFGVNYRKSLRAHSAFPASLLDCLAGFQYLVEELEFEPKNIMLNGDSAGANASMALARYLDDLEHQTDWKWGQIGSMCLHCPWSDLSSSFPSLHRNRHVDSIGNFTYANIPSHTRHFKDKTNPYFSPALPNARDDHFRHLAEKGVKVYISAGTAEGFFDEIKALRDRMKQDGVNVTYREFPGASHSDFVSWDRPIKTAGWTWDLTKEDFEHFWRYTA